MNGPKVTDLKANLKKAQDKKAGTGGIEKLKADIQAIKNLSDVQKVLETLVKITVDQ